MELQLSEKLGHADWSKATELGTKSSRKQSEMSYSSYLLPSLWDLTPRPSPKHRSKNPSNLAVVFCPLDGHKRQATMVRLRKGPQGGSQLPSTAAQTPTAPNNTFQTQEFNSVWGLPSEIQSLPDSSVSHRTGPTRKE